jgi:RNA 2',3'-cyclic 3'-phosphodiesterase
VTAAASVGGDERIRLFCALQLPDSVLDRLVEWQSRFPGGAFRAVPRENLHLTLAFLGHRPLGEVEPIAVELGRAVQGAGRILLTPVGYKETRSVGMLVFVDDDGAAGRLASSLHARLQRLGVYEPEQRPWLPHLTVVRFRERPRLAPEVPGLGAVSPSGAAVYHSVLRPAGAQYAVLHAVAL